MHSVRTASGLVHGLKPDAAGVHVFKGIPFAAPPVGDLRWRPPQPALPWTGVRSCTEFSPACPQPKALVWPLAGPKSEDCLTLNVWTAADLLAGGTHAGATTRAPLPGKDSATGTPGGGRPVMVWIHGGGFTTGAGGSVFYDGGTLAELGAVVVTFNYRLGPFGFFAHPALAAEQPDGGSGNYGLLDQVAALEWVRANIEAFGGDPGNVTVFGNSAGAAGIARLLTAPRARGLFHRAILQSGAARGRNPAPDQGPEADGARIAEALGCGAAASLPACLRSRSADDVLAAANPAQGLFGGGIRFRPVVDGVVLPEAPDQAIAGRRFHRVPVLIGTNADEGTIFLGQIPARTTAEYRSMVRKRFGDRADDVLRLFPAETDGDVPGALNRMIASGAFHAPARSLARSAAAGGVPVYRYVLSRVSPGAAKAGRGAFHAGEVPYVFGRAGNTLTYDDTDRALARTMSAAWVRFAAAGNPNGGDLAEWPVYDPGREASLEFGDAIRVVPRYDDAASDLFDRIHAESDASGIEQ